MPVVPRGNLQALSSAVAPIPGPSSVGADFQDCVVQLNRFDIFGEGYIRDRALVETPERLADLRRFEGCSYAIEHSEGRTCEDQASESKKLLLSQRENSRPIAFSVQSTGPHLNGAKACIVQGSRDLIVGDDLLLAAGNKEFPECPRWKIGSLGQKEDLL